MEIGEIIGDICSAGSSQLTNVCLGLGGLPIFTGAKKQF